ncbi:membrane protein [Streptomyces brasiliensis]|uniref:Membrane protein n=1 Tax=Streptomyces brasiliensis TaxID=1954 RepID=A0A917PEA3_9ACTN|nr:membrane protein [Streptomyces brasiliensis]
MKIVPKEPAQQPRPPREETPAERADRNLSELLQELRVVQTGVQILFAFLLGLAFTSRFPQLNAFQRGTYVVTLLLTVVTSAVLATPVALHRALFHRGLKPRIVTLSARLAQIGLVLLMLSLNGAVFLLMDVVLGRTAAIPITAVTTAIFTGLWFLLPRTARRA